MVLARHEDMVEQFAPKSADKALGEGVDVRGPDRGANDFGADGFAWMILRFFRSRKNGTKIGRKSTSNVCANSQAQVTWLRRKILQRWPRLGFRPVISRISVTYPVALRPRVRDRHWPQKAEPLSQCHRSTVAGCTSVTVARYEAPPNSSAARLSSAASP